jgi:two-component system, chemotaxis family, protein-glutamate methylesterase/glutaminase
MAQGLVEKKYRVLVVGGSAGSLEGLLQLLPALQNEKELAVILVLHRRNGESLLSDLLRGKTSWPVKEAEEKEAVVAGTIYIAPADYHLLIEQDKTFSLDYSEKVHFSRPAIDVTFEAVAETYGPAAMALLLSGANTDGTEGLQKIKEAGGYVMVQDPAEASVDYMPRSAIANVRVDKIISVSKVAALIRQLNA